MGTYLVVHEVEIPTSWPSESVAVSSEIFVLAVSDVCGVGASNEGENTSNEGSDSGGLHYDNGDI